MHNINICDDLWPRQGEWLRFIRNSVEGEIFDSPTLTCGNEYEVQGMMYVPCGDRVKIQDDTGQYFWVPLINFSFYDQRSFYNEGER